MFKGEVVSLDMALKKARIHGAKDSKKRKARFFSRYEKLKGKMSEGTAFAQAKLEKARSHKYIRRIGAPKQYHYIYRMQPFQPFSTDLHSPTDKEFAHEKMRINTMSEKALWTRMGRITQPQKMFNFAQALEDENTGHLNSLTHQAYLRLEKMGYDMLGRKIPEKKAKVAKIKPKIAVAEHPDLDSPAHVMHEHILAGQAKKKPLPVKGEKLKEPGRHIVLADEADAEFDKYREALLAKEKKAGVVKKDKAGNIIVDDKRLNEVKTNGFVRYDTADFNFNIPIGKGSGVQEAVHNGELKPAFWQKEGGPGIMGYATPKAIAEGKARDGGRIIPRGEKDYDHISGAEFNRRYGEESIPGFGKVYEMQAPFGRRFNPKSKRGKERVKVRRELQDLKFWFRNWGQEHPKYQETKAKIKELRAKYHKLGGEMRI